MSIPLPSNSRVKILAAFEGHGAYVRAWGDHYFLTAADLNHHHGPSATWENAEARRRAVVILVGQIEAEPSAAISSGSFRFPDHDEYVQHRRSLHRAISLFRRVYKLKEKVSAALREESGT